MHRSALFLALALACAYALAQSPPLTLAEAQRRAVERSRQLAAHPLRLGMSMSVDVSIRDQSGPVLASAPPEKETARPGLSGTGGFSRRRSSRGFPAAYWRP